MKTHQYILFFVIGLLTSCEEEAILYDFENGQTLASFSVSSADLPTPAEGASIDILITVSTVTNSNRSFVLEIDPSTTATTDQYSLENFGIPAGSARGKITIRGHFDALPEEGKRELILNLTDVSDSNGLTFSIDTLTVSLFRECPPEPTPGIWTINMSDDFGDGWQTTTADGGPGLICSLSTGEVFEFGLCTIYEPSPYDCTDELFSGSASFEIPEGVKSAEWYFPGDFWGEISFEIVAPNGNIVAAFGPGIPEGTVTIDYCAQ